MIKMNFKVSKVLKSQMVSRLEITMFLWRGWWIGSPPLVGVIVGAVRVGVVRPVKSLEVLKS